ncbi:MAG: hypothetical protein DRQ62_03870 [Gammaproteobacteria bacterium]|nr:MAG: hypothetical protein DRQ62_03870 [Gammaproteobacteria bacterium]
MKYLDSDHFPSLTADQQEQHTQRLEAILSAAPEPNMFALIGQYQRILADNHRRNDWPDIHDKLTTLFLAGRPAPLDGPMIGCPISIRDTDYFQKGAELLGHKRSIIANMDWMASAWNMSFADTGIWMGKTFEPISKATLADKTSDDPDSIAAYDSATTRIGRNFFRNPNDPNLLQSIGLPSLEKLWRLRQRPSLENAEIFDTVLTPENAAKEEQVPYSLTGGIFLGLMGTSVLPESNNKAVYQLNYRWPHLKPVYPMTRLVDELVQIGEGIYLGQLIWASKHYALTTLDNESAQQIGEEYQPNRKLSFLEKLLPWNKSSDKVDYGYQNNGYFIMMDPACADKIYADDAFPQLRPRAGEHGFQGQESTPQSKSTTQDWINGWKKTPALVEKFTTLLLEPSPKESDNPIVREMLQPDESVLQMLQRISNEISQQTRHADQIKHFEQLHSLFRCGIAPGIENGLFKRNKPDNFNARVDGSPTREWYGEKDPCIGLDYYHGANLNLHCGFIDTIHPEQAPHEFHLFPGMLADKIADSSIATPNILNEMWHSIGKYIFPWAGKSYEKISPRKLSMLVDESNDLAVRYPQRVKELKNHPASLPHYIALKKNQHNFWDHDSQFHQYLKDGSWDNGMTNEQKEFWKTESSNHWIFGNNLQDSRIVSADPLLKLIDMNYKIPEPAIQAVTDAGPSPFARQGYCFLGVSDRDSILPINNDSQSKKKVFQFQYRFPMIGGPAPIGFCLDELVEIADGLFLGQLIYATNLALPFSSSVDPSEYNYQLFGYFVLLDDDWQKHRLAIKLDTLD